MKTTLTTFLLLIAIFTQGQVGIGVPTSSINPSAQLDVNSTTKGFLPPRLTTIQRDAITTPAAGLTIWNSTNTQLEVYDGSYWVNMVGKLVSTLNVGDSFGGGKIFYIFTSGDPGYVAGQTHGLIAATSDQTTNAGIKWFSGAFYGATGTTLGSGLVNTALIIATAGTASVSSYAAGLANSCRDGDYTDWYLPSKDELHKLFLNKDVIGNFVYTDPFAYWSSSQSGQLNINNYTTGITSSWVQLFTDGTKTSTSNTNTKRVRAIRIF